MEKTMTMEETNRALQKQRTKEKLKKIFANVFIYFVLLLMYAPLIYITVFSFTPHKVAGQWGGFSFENYTTLFNYGGNKNAEKIWDAARNTALVAVTSAASATILGTLGAIGIYYLRKKWLKNTLDFVTQIPVVNAEIVTAVSLCVLFVILSNFIPRSFLTLVIGHTVLGIPFVTPLTFRTLSRNPVESELFDRPDDWRPGHISLAEAADLVVVAPATANTLFFPVRSAILPVRGPMAIIPAELAIRMKPYSMVS